MRELRRVEVLHLLQQNVSAALRRFYPIPQTNHNTKHTHEDLHHQYYPRRPPLIQHAIRAPVNETAEQT